MIIESKPWVKIIIEDILSCDSRYQLHQIRSGEEYYENETTLWFNKSASLTIYFRKPIETDLLLKHKVGVQFPGNQDYGFSVSIKD